MNKLLLLLASLFPAILTAQKASAPFVSKTTSEAGATLSSNGSTTALAFSMAQYWGFGKKKKNFKVGIGARLTSSLGNSNVEYITAPAILTSGQTGPGVFFASQIPENIDTLTLGGSQVNALNAFLALRYDFAKKWGVEFNIDLIGFSFGASRTAVLKYGDQKGNTRISPAKPSTFNGLLISDNDYGSLNSELLIFYKMNSNFRLKAGASFLFSEYTIDNPPTYTNSKGTIISNDRFRSKALMIAVGVNYIFRNKHK